MAASSASTKTLRLARPVRRVARQPAQRLVAGGDLGRHAVEGEREAVEFGNAACGAGAGRPVAGAPERRRAQQVLERPGEEPAHIHHGDDGRQQQRRQHHRRVQQDRAVDVGKDRRPVAADEHGHAVQQAGTDRDVAVEAHAIPAFPHFGGPGGRLRQEGLQAAGDRMADGARVGMGRDQDAVAIRDLDRHVLVELPLLRPVFRPVTLLRIDPRR